MRNAKSLLLGCVMAGALLTGPAVSQEVDIKVQTVGGGVSMLMGQGGNIGLFTGSDGTFLIDDQFAPLTGKILAATSRSF